MPKPRRELVDVARTPYYHVTSRCVRRAYLCGTDRASGKSYEHRKQWIEERIRLLASIFAIDICAYAVMSNHYHIVLRINANEPGKLSDTEVINRWRCLYRGSALIQKASQRQDLYFWEHADLKKTISIYRDRLGSLSWFMKALNEPIAKMANREDGCAGHFWESRFCSQALGTTAALMACMVYVDSNPFRAGIATTPDKAAHTSIRERLSPSFNKNRAVHSQMKTASIRNFSVPLKPLQPFLDSPIEEHGPHRPNLPFSFAGYVELLRWTSNRARSKKHSANDAEQPGLLTRFRLVPDTWLNESQHFETLYKRGAFRFPKSRRSSLVCPA